MEEQAGKELLLPGYFLIKRNEILNFIISLRRHKLFYLVTDLSVVPMYPGDISGHTESNVNIRCNSVAFVPWYGVMNHRENFKIEILLSSV